MKVGRVIVTDLGTEDKDKAIFELRGCEPGASKKVAPRRGSSHSMTK